LQFVIFPGYQGDVFHFELLIAIPSRNEFLALKNI
jgi:hypothetical protein